MARGAVRCVLITVHKDKYGSARHEWTTRLDTLVWGISPINNLLPWEGGLGKGGQGSQLLDSTKLKTVGRPEPSTSQPLRLPVRKLLSRPCRFCASEA